MTTLLDKLFDIMRSFSNEENYRLAAEAVRLIRVNGGLPEGMPHIGLIPRIPDEPDEAAETSAAATTPASTKRRKGGGGKNVTVKHITGIADASKSNLYAFNGDLVWHSNIKEKLGANALVVASFNGDYELFLVNVPRQPDIVVSVGGREVMLPGATHLASGILDCIAIAATTIRHSGVGGDAVYS